MNSNDLILSLSSADFRVFFNSELLPLLKPIEKRRLELQKKKRLATAIFVVVLISMFALLIYLAIYHMQTTNELEFHLAILSFVAVIMVYTLTINDCNQAFRLDVGSKVMPKLFSYFGDFKFGKKGVAWSECVSEHTIQNLLDRLAIYPRYTNIDIDDCIQGIYNDLKIRIVELNLSHEEGSGKNRHTVVDFNGLMLEVNIHKDLGASHTIIKSDSMFNAKKHMWLEKVALEDVEFERAFEVYSNDQIKSRYILTPSFMSRLLEFRCTKGNTIEAVFSDNKAYFFVGYQKDNFEIPFNRCATDFKHYQSVVLDLARMLRLVDTLKLEENIGL